MRATTVILSLLAISVVFAIQSSAYEWHTITVDPDVGSCRSSIAMDSNGYPHISYYEDYTDHDLKYAYWTGSQWQIEIVDSEGDVGDANSLALDSQGYPHISYYDSDNGDLKYAFWNGDSWIIEVVDSQGDVGGGSLALDSQGYPHIAYCDCTNRDVKYAYWNGANWVIETVDSVGDVGMGISFALDSQDHPHISYIEYVSSDEKNLKYAHRNGSNWEIETIESPMGFHSYGTCLEVDTQDHPGIIYNGYGLDYAHWNGSEWQFQIVDDHHPADPFSFSLALDSQDFPNISFWSPYMTHPPGEEWGLFYERWDGSQWEIFNPYAQDYMMDVGETSIALDGFDNPYIAHTTYDLSLGLTWYGDNLAINLLSFTATPQGNAVVLNWQVETTEDEQIAGFNLYRREIAPNSVAEAPQLPQNKGVDSTKVNPYLITGQNPYAYTDSAVETGKSYEYKLEAVLADESIQILGTASCAPTPPAFAIAKVYPNPVCEVMSLNVESLESGPAEIRIYDLSGRLVFSQELFVDCGNNLLTINLSDVGMKSGVYIVQFSSPGISEKKTVVFTR
jgi:hypothetical protein